MEVPQYSGAKWGDCDNDNVRSALAGGLLRLMDALIISKQELQWFGHAVCAYIKRPFLGATMQKMKPQEKSRGFCLARNHPYPT